MAEAQEPHRFLFNSLQKQTIITSLKNNEITKKYIETLSEKILELDNKASSLRKKADSLDVEIEQIKKTITSLDDEAQKQYKEAVKTVVSDFDTPPPPWRAIIIYDNGNPIGVDLLREKKHLESPGS